MTAASCAHQLMCLRVICLSASVFSLTNAQLQSLLSKNRQSKSGTKDVLIARVVENSLLGNLPRCSKCSKGTLFYAVSERTGERAEWRVACVCVGKRGATGRLTCLASPRLVLHLSVPALPLQAGAYHCHGSFDPVTMRTLLCDFHADRVERSVWQQ